MKRKITSDSITTLKKNQVFVFGSNLNGNHSGGAAKLALDNFGAINGQAFGLQGNSFAIPTLDKQMNRQNIWDLEEWVKKFEFHVHQIPEKHFLLTEIGCGIAGFKVEEIAPLFARLFKDNPSNISWPRRFVDYLEKSQPFNLSTYKIPDDKVLVLRSCNNNMTSYNNFKWASSGIVTCPDFKATKECGKGLHGFLKGEGDGSLANFESDKWLVLEVDKNTIIDLGGKVKFPSCEVIFCGCQKDASQILVTLYPECKVVGGTATAGDSGTATAGDSGTATAGYSGTATAGDRGTATAGDRGTATAGYRGTATAGDRGTATAGDRGTATAGYRGTATAGYSGTATAGDRGTATAGDSGTATAGYRGTATAGDSGTATAGYSGTATAGDSGCLIIEYYDSNNSCYRKKITLIGENGIKPNIKYKLNSKYEFEEVSQ